MSKATNNKTNIKDIEEKISELKSLSKEYGIDVGTDIDSLTSKINSLKSNKHKTLDVWERVQLARSQNRPTTLDYIKHLFNDFIEFHGDRQFGDDKAIVGGIALYKGKPVTIIGHQKGNNTKENLLRNFGMPHPEGYRKALRLMEQANKFNRPIICFINTAGAYPGKEAEQRGQSEAIARNLKVMSALRVPIISIVIGEGGSGGALALGVGNHIYMLENTFYSVISPEGAASLLWKDANRAQEAAEALKISPPELLKLGVIDSIIPEAEGGAHNNIALTAKYIDSCISNSLQKLSLLSPKELMENRYQKFRVMGEFESTKVK